MTNPPIFAHMRSTCCNVASLFVGRNCEDESVFGLGLWHVQKGICSSMRLHIQKPNKTHLLRLCLVGSSFEDESVFGLTFWQMQKGISIYGVYLSIYLSIHPSIYLSIYHFILFYSILVHSIPFFSI